MSIYTIVFKALLVFGLLLQYGCNNTEPNNQTSPQAQDDSAVKSDKRWSLASYSIEGDEHTSALRNINVTIAFTSSDQGTITGFTGFDGCNVFVSDQVMLVGENVLQVNGVNVDAGFCAELQTTDYLQQNDFFYSVITSSFTYVNSDEQIILQTPTKRTLRFEPCIPIDPDSLDSGCGSIPQG